ncbi:MAG: hypothetical protein H8D43_02770 [Chloroflexi bacterium]|nr:hypothetical protein [Chloroflexota bacterium]
MQSDEGLQDRLPLRWIVPSDTPPSPKKAYRSHYVYLGGWQDLQDATAFEHLSPFDLILRLVDFTPLRAVLAHLLGWTSTRGRVPFDPIYDSTEKRGATSQLHVSMIQYSIDIHDSVRSSRCLYQTTITFR